MNLDNRLKRITDFIPSDSYILDVGCDHALLDIYLALNRNNVKLIASDINENPLKIAKENIKKYNLEDEITLEKADGVSKINDEVDTVVIAGMGTSTINDIINNDLKKLKNVKKIIISSHTSSFELRENMNKKGFKIIDEAVVFDKGKYYEIIVYSNGYEKLSKLDMKYGPIISKRKDEITKAYFNERYLKLIEIYKKIPNGNKKLKDDLNKKIKEIKKFL
ncbi:MAG: class I SAM-dependent methyltransferase [Bacilli bacterium]|nr:class I SAM-dependent methyltransferase [Mycoplasmatota bacterium]MDY4237115.1 class I SAM-dependent methyltransferase [Bacilli bacterium]